MNRPDKIVATTVVAADAETAFDVFTREVDAWWKQGRRFRPMVGGAGVMRFEPGVGGRLLEEYQDGSHFELGRVKVWEPGRRLVFEMRGVDFRPGEFTKVVVRFEPAGEATHVTVEHSGWSQFADDHPVRHGLGEPAFSNVLGVWWGDVLVSLQMHAAKRNGDGR